MWLTSCWLQAIQCPHEIVWLNGAPGAGKVNIYICIAHTTLLVAYFTLIWQQSRACLWAQHAANCMRGVQGANTPFIMKSRGLSRAVPMSEMLERNPQIKHLMEAGELVPDVSYLHIPARCAQIHTPPCARIMQLSWLQQCLFCKLYWYASELQDVMYCNTCDEVSPSHTCRPCIAKAF